MSVVDNFILIASFAEDNIIDDLNATILTALVEDQRKRHPDLTFGPQHGGFGSGFKKADQCAGGPKFMERDVYLLATNFLNASELVPMLRAFLDYYLSKDEYCDRDGFQLFVCGQDSKRFSEVEIWK